MKQTQLAGAVVALALMVFVVTFAMNYIGGNPQPVAKVTTEPRRPPISLKFHNVKSSDQAIECENKVPGYHDYWFTNPNDEPVKLGLNHKNCTCSGVSLFVPPSEFQEQARSLSADAVKLLAPGTLGASAGSSPAGGAVQAVQASAAAAKVRSLTEATQGQEMLNNEPVVVPAGATGWVRMRWSGEKMGRQRLIADLWMDRNEPEQRVELEALLLFHEPLRVRREAHVGMQPDGSIKELRDEDLPRRETIKVWSSTRRELHLQAQSATVRGRPESDPFVVGAPEPMTPEELKKLEKENNSGNYPGDFNPEGQVLCGYRIPVTLNRVSADGSTPFDLGPFRRWVVIRADDDKIESVQVLVHGRVRGAVSMAIDEEGGGLNLGSFHSNRAITKSINLRAETGDISLDVDRARTPGFLQASVRKQPGSSDKGPWLWELKVEIKKGAVSGPFPRRDDPQLRDSAIYLTATRPGQPPRAIRIPVIGTANER